MIGRNTVLAMVGVVDAQVVSVAAKLAVGGPAIHAANLGLTLVLIGSDSP